MYEDIDYLTEWSNMWYVMQVMSGDEKKTIQMCQCIVEEEYIEEIFTPEIERMKRFRGEWHKVKKMMFPGYVFVSTDRELDLYENLRVVPALTKILKTGDAITPVSAKEEAFIKRLIGKDKVAEISVGYIEGDKLIVSEGPLMGMEALVKKIDRHKRIAVLQVEMFGSATEVTMGLEVLSKN